MSHLQSRSLPSALLLAGLCCNMYAVDGIVLIDQNRALAGNVTPGDAPGFPVTISVSGSYRLSGNLTVPNANTNGILITADNVTIDLNGFSILGPTVCVGTPVTSCSPTGSGSGVFSGLQKVITVVNGIVRGMGFNGLSLFGDSAIVERVQAESNGEDGINVFRATVRGNTANRNGFRGIFAGCPSTIVENTAANNNTAGLVTTGAGCAVANNAAP